MDKSLAKLESMYTDRDEWADKYGADQSLSSQKTLTRAYYYTAGSVCLLEASLLLVVFIKGMYIGGS